MKEIKLTQGLVALVDDADYERFGHLKWNASRSKGGFYARRWSPRENGKRVYWTLHRLIMDAPPGMEVDHRDRNRLNNQRSNLRLCSKLENNRNHGLNRSNTSGYKGVSFSKRHGKWRAYIRVNGKLKTLGYFSDPRQAAQAYDLAAEIAHGPFACPNK